MCIIAVSKAGAKQPTLDQLRNMFDRNPDGAGYMYARDGKVTIHKGFTTFDDFSRAVKAENFTINDPVVYHFRISTQAGKRPEMTHPFPLTEIRENCEALDLTCSVGIAHNGIIRMTSDAKEMRFSDTVIFITDYMTKLIRNHADITDKSVNEMIEYLTNSKWAIMDGSTGNIVTVGKFIEDDGVLFSNTSYVKYCKTTIVPPLKFSWDDYKDGYYGVGV
jgi:predicted glutamine amidotransferase